ncbi:hypothetical protein CMZ84_11550 [Lysobacteraceae bacterium NML93-0399]|nr:hypothetical protein CMZ84_11550 [Xanthomonadaceae bacterium NML93-0399]
MTGTGIQGPSTRIVSARRMFQWLSYLQYLALLAALVFAVRAGFAAAGSATSGWAPVYEAANMVLLHAGIGIGLSSLQDPGKTQNAVSRRAWEDPRTGPWMLGLIAGYALGAMVLGLVGAYVSGDPLLGQLSLGLLAFGLGMVGLLQTAMEMREHHRLDRNPPLAHGTAVEPLR